MAEKRVKRCQFCGAELAEDAWECECGAYAYVSYRGWNDEGRKPTLRLIGLCLIPVFAGWNDGALYFFDHVLFLLCAITGRHAALKALKDVRVSWELPKATLVMNVADTNIKRVKVKV